MSSTTWLELSHILGSAPPPPPPYLNGFPPPPPSINALAFDSTADLLFTANSNGGVCSWYGPGLARYTAWKADVRHTVPITVPAAAAAASSSSSSSALQKKGTTTDDDTKASPSSSSSPSSAAAPTANTPRRLQTSWKKAPPVQLPPPPIPGPGGAGQGGARTPAAGPSGIRELHTDSGNVYSVSPLGLHCATRRGVARWSKDVAAMGHPSLALRSLCPSASHASSSEIVVAGSSHLERDQQILSINRHVGSVVRDVSAAGNVLQVRKAQRFLLSSTQGGHIQCRDPRSLEVEHKLHAHPGGVIDMKSEGSLVWSVGWTMRLGHPVPEPLVKVHDLRSLRALVPIPFAAPGGPALLDIHPRMSSTVVVAAPQGAWQIVDMNNPGEAGFYQMSPSNSNSMLTSLSLSPSAEYIAFGEADGSVRLWSTSESAAALNHPETMANAPKFNPFGSQPPEMPDGPEVLPRHIDWTADTPLSSVGLPYYDNDLLSVLPFENYAAESSPLFNPFPPKIDSGILASVRTADGVHFAPLPRHLRGRRNVVHVTGRGFPPAPGRHNIGGARGHVGGERRTASGKTPMFRSEKFKAQQQRNHSSTSEGDDAGGDDDDDADADSGDAARDSGAPTSWRKKDIVYSKFGVEDFDFEYYNKTSQSGLETHIPNCYLNSLLQCFFQLAPLRALSEIHTLSGGKARCEREDCLLCEAGFLFMMLRDARGTNCQATNFLRAFGKSGRAVSMGLMDSDTTSSSLSSDVAYANLIQSVNRFLLDAMAASWAEMAVVAHGNDPKANNKGLLEDTLAPTVNVSMTCLSCGHVAMRPSKALVVDMLYPRKSPSNEPAQPSDFASVLKASLLRESVTKGACKGCGNPGANIRSRRELPEAALLPQTMSINANILTEAQLRLWIDGPAVKDRPRKQYLPSRISIRPGHAENGEQPVVKALAEDETPPEDCAVYRVKSMVVQVQTPKERSHLVAVARVPDLPDDASSPATWYLYNDFLVRSIPEEEALSFPPSAWKVPAVIFLERIDAQAMDLKSIPWERDMSVLTEDLNESRHRDPAWIRHRALSPDEIPSPGTLVSIDAEFVALNPEEMELSSTGTRSLIRPSTMSLARVSVLRGQGPSEGEPFIDDHISTQEKIFDYLTQFSGIVDGDLDPARSRHTVVQQKLAYKKLRLLVDCGCTFIGHGLKKDFRIINIHVPQRQVIDTVDLFSSTSQARKLSLKFLSWFLLKESIQGTGGASASPSKDDARVLPSSVDSLPSGAQDASPTQPPVQGHDSIEDARAALHLYRIYETFQRDGRLEDVLEDLYEEGKRLNWRPPPPPPAAAMATAAQGTQSAMGAGTASVSTDTRRMAASAAANVGGAAGAGAAAAGAGGG